MTIAIRAHFPSNRAEWVQHLKILLPIILGQTLFAFNGFVDNFMVGHIQQGVTALSAVNSWTNIVNGFYFGVTAAGSIILAQFFYAGKFHLTQEIARLRYLISLGFTLVMVIIALTMPNALIGVFLKAKTASASHTLAMENAREYMRIIVFQWILMAIVGTVGDLFRETKYGYVTLIWGITSLATNMTLNSILMYQFDLGVAGAAWASIASSFVALGVAITYIYLKKMRIGFKPWTLFVISRRAWMLFWHRLPIFLAFTTIIAFITLRNYFYDAGYMVSDDSPLGAGVGAMMVLGLTGAIQNVFTTTFSGLSSMAAIFVGSEQGKKNFRQAKINSDKLKGFNTLIAAGMALMLVIIAFAVPSMDFLSQDQTDGTDFINHKAHLQQVRDSLFVIAAYYPMWIWFCTSYRNAFTGGRGFWFAFTDWFVSGPVQLGFVALLMLVIVPSSTFLEGNFAAAYAIFFLTDFIKLVIIEILYYKTNWVRTMVHDDDN